MALVDYDNKKVDYIKIIRDIAPKLDSTQAYDLIVKAGYELTNASFCNIGIVRNNKMYFYPLIEECNDETFARNIDEGIMGWVVSKRRPRLVPDVTRVAYYIPCNKMTKSELSVPIIYKDKCIGVLNVESDKEKAFKKFELDVLRALADFAASAINNARRHEELKTLREIDQKITSSLDLMQTLELIKQKASELISTEEIRIRLREGESEPYILKPVTGVQQSQILAATWRSGECIVGMAAKDKRAILVNDVQNNDFFKKALSQIHDPKRIEDLKKINSEIAVPLLIQDKVIGVLNAHSPKKDAFTKDDCILLKALADQASIAIENARLYNDLKKQIDILEELNKIGTHIVNLDLEKVLRRITGVLHEIVKVDIPMIYLLSDKNLLSEKKNNFGIVYGDIRKDWESECHPRPNGAGCRAIIKNEIQIIHEEKINDFPRSKGVKTTIAIPLRSWDPINQKGRKIAVAYLHFLGEKHSIDSGQYGKLKALFEDVEEIIASEIIDNEDGNNQVEIIRDSIAMKFDRQKVNERINEIVRADIILIYTFNDKTNSFGNLCYSTLGMSWKDNNNPRISSGLGHKAIEENELCIAYEKTSPNINPIPLKKGVKTTVAVPLVSNEKKLGVMYLHFLAKERIISSEENKAIKAFAANAAVAIEKAKSYEDLKELYEIGKIMTSKIKLDDLIIDIEKSAKKIEPMGTLFIALFDRKTNSLSYLPTAGHIDPEIAEIGCEVIKTGTHKIMRNTAKAIAAFAMEIENRRVGVLYFCYSTEKLFSHEEILRLYMFTGKVAIAINNALKYESLVKIIYELDELRGIREINEINDELVIDTTHFNLSDLIMRIGRAGMSVNEDDLEFIFQKLFWDFKKIGIAPLIQGYGRAGVFMITPAHDLAIARHVIAKIGPKEDILKEQKNFNKYVKWFIGGMRSTNLMASAYSDMLGGIVYSLIGNPMRPGKYCSFENYYHQRDFNKIEECINKLFTETCVSWYSNRKGDMKDLVLIYIKELSLDINTLKERYADKFPKFFNNDRIVYKDINDSFIQPINWISKHKLSRVLDLSFCITHGDLNKNNIISDDQGNPWLIDFMRTGESYILRDFIRLETTIKFELLDNKIDFQSYYEFEKALTSSYEIADPRLNDPAPIFSNNPDVQLSLEKAFRAISKIRSLAYYALGIGAVENIHQYYIGLLLQTLKFLTWDDVNNYHFVLISSSLLCKKLENLGLFEPVQFGMVGYFGPV